MAKPILPELRLPRKRTGSRSSKVGPALTTTLRPGTFDLPPCPGLRLPFEGARLAASGVAGDDGRVLLSMTPPAWAAGNVAGFVPVELGTCRQGNLVVSGF